MMNYINAVDPSLFVNLLNLQFVFHSIVYKSSFFSSDKFNQMIN